MDKEQFEHQQCYSKTEQGKGKDAMVVFTVAMLQWPAAYNKGKGYHPGFKSGIMDDVYAKQR